MQWKALLSVAVLAATLLPQAAWSRNHHMFDNGMNGFANQGQMPLNNGMFNGFANHGPMPFNNGMPNTFGNQGLTPFANTGMPGGCNGNNGQMGFGNSSMFANGMMANGMQNVRRHHRKKKHRNGLMQQLNAGGLNNYNNGGYGYNGAYAANQFGGVNNGGIRGFLNRL